MVLLDSPVALSACSAFCFAASHVAAKRGLRSSDVVGSLVVSLIAALALLTTALVIDHPEGLSLKSFLIFSAAGAISPGLARWAAVSGVDRLGPSVSVPITQGARPLVAVAIALVFLGESISPAHGIGIIAIVLGGWVLSTDRVDSEILADGVRPPEPLKRSLRKGISFPLMAAGAFAVSDVLIRWGLTDRNDPTLAAVVGIGSGLGVWLLSLLIFRSVRESARFKGGIRWNLLSGLLVGLAALTLYAALQRGDVSVVSPIAAMQPLAVFVLSAILLRDLERLNARTIGAGLVVVSGCVLVAL